MQIEKEYNTLGNLRRRDMYSNVRKGCWRWWGL